MNVGLLRQWIPHPTSQALRIVNKVIKSHPTPLSTKEIYNLALTHHSPAKVQHQQRAPLAVKDRVPPPVPPHPEHPVRSIRYLKLVVLPALRAQGKIEKTHTKRTLDAAEVSQRLGALTKAGRKAKAASLAAPIDTWVWQPATTSAKTCTVKTKTVTAKVMKGVVGEEVGVGEDWSHLNKRRRRARVGKVARDVGRMRERARGERTKERVEEALQSVKN